MESHEHQVQGPAGDIQLPVGKLLENIPFEEYAKAEGINAGGLKIINEFSPAHYYQDRYGTLQKKESTALRFGKLFHFAVLEPHIFQQKAVIVPKFEGFTKDGRLSTQSGEAKEKKKAWYAALPQGAIICEQHELDSLLFMCDKLLKHPLCRNLLEKGVKETTLVWDDEEFGVKCKARPDFISDAGIPVNIKSSMNASPEAFMWDVSRRKYDLEASHYLAGGKATGQYRSDAYFFLVVEKEPPYEIAVYGAGTSIVFAGDGYRQRAMKRYAECLRKNEWPGYQTKASDLDYPPGKVDALQAEFEREQQEAARDFIQESGEYAN